MAAFLSGAGSSWYRLTMDTTMLSSLAHLSDQELLARMPQLAADERQATALLIAHLAELDARRLYLAEGYSSVFTYCTQVLHLSEHAAYARIEAARAARKFQVLLEMLSEGSVTLTSVGLLAPHLTAENHQELLERARYQSKRAVEELIAGLFPQPPVPTLVRRLPAARPRPASPMPLDAVQEDPPASPPAPTKQPATVAPLAPQRYKVQFTASAETYEKQRVVWLRDGGRCAYVGSKGRRCGESGFLEFHHVKPHAAGGESTVDNIQLRCRGHNVYEAELYFGAGDLAGVRERRAAYSVRTEFSLKKQRSVEWEQIITLGGWKRLINHLTEAGIASSRIRGG
jgi:hypothetical protein